MPAGFSGAPDCIIILTLHTAARGTPFTHAGKQMEDDRRAKINYECVKIY